MACHHGHLDRRCQVADTITVDMPCMTRQTRSAPSPLKCVASVHAVGSEVKRTLSQAVYATYAFHD